MRSSLGALSRNDTEGRTLSSFHLKSLSKLLAKITRFYKEVSRRKSIVAESYLRALRVLRGYLILVKVPPTHMVHPELL